MIHYEKHKQILLKEKALLEKELEMVAVADPNSEGGFRAKEDNFASEPSSLDPTEIGSELESFARNESIASELETRYQNVVAALKRIENGSYGICCISGEPIEEDRLEANPAADTCKVHMND